MIEFSGYIYFHGKVTAIRDIKFVNLKNTTATNEYVDVERSLTYCDVQKW